MGLLLPGTTIEVGSYANQTADYVLTNIFAAGGIVLSQMSTLTGLEAYTIQNWVKRGFLPPPVHRQYSRRQFTRVVIINMLKDSMKIDQVIKLLTYINGAMNREDDDTIEDPMLYHLFVNLLGQLEGEFPSREALKDACDKVLLDFHETVAHSRERIRTVLMVMVYAWLSTRSKQQAELLMRDMM